MSSSPLSPIESCPFCGDDLAAISNDGCGSCGAPIDETTLVVRGRRPGGWPAWMLLLLWAIPIGVAAALGAPGFAAAAAILMLAHCAYLVYRGSRAADSAQAHLLVTRQGVGELCGGRMQNLRPYHLFDEARLSRVVGVRPGDDRQPRWRLTIVNAYKPSISVYLHSRGTEAPIFCSAFDLTIEAAEPDAVALQSRLQQAMDEARAAYRATKIREADQLAIAHRRFALPRTCPHCDVILERSDDREHCEHCHSYVCFDPARPRFVLDAEPVTWSPGLGLLSIGVAAVSLWPLLLGNMAAAIPGLALSGLYGGWRLWKFTERHAGPARQWLVTRDGLEIWQGDQCEQRMTWHDLPTLRYVQLERGSWRLALWQDGNLRVAFSPFLFTWFSSPVASPAFDAVLTDTDLAGKLICREIARRHATELQCDERAAQIVIERTHEAQLANAPARAPVPEMSEPPLGAPHGAFI